jgi:type III pantothenate kinase
MTILLVDIGNSRVKWAMARGAGISRMGAVVHEGNPAAMSAVIGRAPADVDRIVAVGVAGPRFERALATAATDRWVGVIGAHGLARGRAVLVANIGTALTLDAVGPSGRHLGGAIVPGPEFMIESLLAGTHGIRRRARGDAANGARLFASNTASAIAAGARFAAAALIERSVEEAARSLGSRPLLLLTGGGAADVSRRIRIPRRVVPDLVLRGLAVFARGSAKAI